MAQVRLVLLVGVLVVAVAACVTPGEAPSDSQLAERQRLVEHYASELPWPVLNHATFVVHPAQDSPAHGVSDCPSRTIHIYPSAFSSDQLLRWVIAHESGHQRDCDGLPAEFYDLIRAAGESAPHSPDWTVGEGLADCMAKYWLGFNMGRYWDCPYEIVARVPEFAPN